MEYTYIEAFDDKENLCGYHRSDGAFVPADPANSDYQRYLNPDKVEHLTEIPIKGADLATLASELSNPSTPQAGE